jgi:hypothetical protein
MLQNPSSTTIKQQDAAGHLAVCLHRAMQLLLCLLLLLEALPGGGAKLLLLLLLLLQGIGAAVSELEPSAVSGSLVCLLRELLGDVYADVRLTALQQVLAVGELVGCV